MKQDLQIFNTIAQALLEAESQQPVADFIEAESMGDFIDLHLNENALQDSDFENTLKELVLGTPRTSTRLFFNQLFGGRNGKAVLGDLLAVLLNNSMYTYKVAGLQVGVEKEVIARLCEMTGYDNESGGTIAPGSSICNLMGMIMARDAFHSDIRENGNTSGLVLYTSAESHYSIPKNASFMGLGRNSVRYVQVDDQGRMLPESLEILIKKDLQDGRSPFFVNATTGTTVLGAFDPLIPISELCKKYGLWLHVDGAYGGGTIFSKKYRFLMKGIERADSLCLNAHKMLGTPLTCSIILTKNKKSLFRSFANDASYLYQTNDDNYNLGKVSMQCGRRNDALKLWTVWKYVGTKGLRANVDKQYHLADVARAYIRSNKDYTLYSFDDSLSVCFNYKNVPAKRICTELYENGKAMIGFGKFRGEEFIRLVTVNSGNSEQDILAFFKTMEQYLAKNITALSSTQQY